MISSNLYKKALIEPVSVANELFALSGYASATFTRRHINDLLETSTNFKINLIIGMPGKRSDHLAFVKLHDDFKGIFRGYYLTSAPPVHSKVYSWYDGEQPILGFAGSANYSQYGFFESQQVNQLSIENPKLIKDFYDEILERAIYIPELEIEFPVPNRPPRIQGSVEPGQINWEIPNRRVTISFLTNSGELPRVSGLNWGQRLEKRKNRNTGEIKLVRRDPNQAYLSLKKNSREEGFLPARAYNFTLITDDGETFDCVVAQDGIKAIQTTNDNSLLGAYIRKRIGVNSGQLITEEDLERYGRTDYTIEKIDDETFLLDFQV